MSNPPERKDAHDEELKRALAEAGQARERYVELYDFTPVGYFTLDGDGKILEANLAGASLLGIERASLIGSRLQTFIAPLSLPAFQEALRGVPSDVSMAAGSPRWAHLVASPSNDGKYCVVMMDISERKMAEEALRASEENYRLLYETMAEGVVHQDAGGAIVSANPEALRMLGLTLDQITGRTSLDSRWRAIHEDGSEFPGETHPSMMALRTGKSVRDVRMGVFNPRENGWRWITINAIARFRAGEEKPFQVYTTFRDITDRRRMEEALAEREAKYRGLVETTGAGVATTDLEGRLTYVNQALCDMLGHSKDELVGMPFSAFSHPEDTGRVAALFAGALQTPRRDVRFDFKAIHKDGRIIHLYTNPTASWHQERVIGFNAIIQDITELKRVEHALRANEKWFALLFNGVSDAVFVHEFEAPDGLPGRFIGVNDMACQRLGYTRAELLKMRAAEIDAPETRAAFPAIMEKLRREKSAQWEGVHVRKDGGRIQVEITNRLLEGDGRLVILSMVRDITERKRVEKDLNESHLRLRLLAEHLLFAREEERKTVAQEIHDELGQVLTALKMDLRWLEKRLAPSQAHLLEKMRGMTSLTDQTIQRVQRISSELRPRMLDDLGLTAAIEWLVGDFSRRTGIRCKTAVQVTESRIGGNSVTAIYRIVQEALTNISRHASASRVSVLLREVDERLEVLIKDDGIGISETQATDARSFGLIGIRERVHGLGGGVSISGETGKGTTVAISIPYPGGGNLA